MKAISILTIIFVLLPLPAKALDTKTLGKVTMVGILSATAFVVKMLILRDQKAVVRLHESMGLPDKVMEFRKGFDHWRLEWYGEKVYYFRNGVIWDSPELPIFTQTE